MKKIVLTGGGTAGHVTPNIALIPALEERDYSISYIGTYEGIEKKLIESTGIDYYGISSGKLRRYMDIKNLTDPFKVVKGIVEARKILKKIKPDVVFSKGGFVAVPVVLAASMLKIPIVIHESDITPGLANKISIPRASKVCCNFPDTLNELPQDKAVYTGSPVRKELFSGSKDKAKALCKFPSDKPTIMVIGGSQGSIVVNNAIRRILPKLASKYNIIHLCGKGKVDEGFVSQSGYVQFEYIKEELKDLFSLADVVVSRAGANAISELLAIAKPNILIPLGRNASRGDQILNANSFVRQGFSSMIEEEDLTDDKLLSTIDYVYENRDSYINTMKNHVEKDPVQLIVDEIDKAVYNIC